MAIFKRTIPFTESEKLVEEQRKEEIIEEKPVKVVVKKTSKVNEYYNEYLQNSEEKKKNEKQSIKFQRSKSSQSLLELQMKKKNGEILTATIGDMLKKKIEERENKVEELNQEESG